VVFINHACKFGIPSCFCAQNLGFSMNIFSFENLVLNLLNLDLAQTRYYRKVYMTNFSFIPSLRLDSTTPFGRGERNGMEWKKKKEYFKNILFFPLFGSLSRREWKGMERPFPCLGV
jgi:hypothetical protein